MLMQQAYSLAKKLHKTKIWLGVSERNLKALALYKKEGFKKIGMHTFWIGDTPDEDMIFEKWLY